MISSCANPPCYDVLVEPGYYFCDLIFTGLQEMPRLGKDTFSSGFDLVPGGNFHVVRALHRLGVRVGWPCDFGSDIFSRFVLEAASKEGIDTRLFRVHDRPLRSLSVSLSFAHDRAFVSYMDGFPPTPLPELIKELQPRFVLLMGIHTGDEIRAVGAAARQVGAMVVIDPQWHERCWDEPEVRDALQWADFFLPNQSEACQLTDQESVEAALDRLVDLVPRVVIKLGPRWSSCPGRRRTGSRAGNPRAPGVRYHRRRRLFRRGVPVRASARSPPGGLPAVRKHLRRSIGHRPGV